MKHKETRLVFPGHLASLKVWSREYLFDKIQVFVFASAGPTKSNYQCCGTKKPAFKTINIKSLYYTSETNIILYAWIKH